MEGRPVLTAFDHPSHREAEEMSAQARRLMRAGKLEEARELYSRAARGELVVARTLDSRRETDDLSVTYARKMRSILAISAAACFVKAQQWGEAAKAAREFLALPDLLLADGAQELEGLLDQAQRALDVLPKAKRNLTRPPELVLVRILEERDGPLLTQYRSAEGGELYLERWCARTGSTEHFLLVRSNLRAVEKYMAKRITLRSLLNSGDPGCILIDRTALLDKSVTEMYSAWLDDLPASYLPSDDSYHNESLRPAWAHTVQSFLLGDDWSGEVISAIEKNYIDVSAFLYYTTSPVAEAMLPRVVLGYDYRGGFPVVSAFKVLRAQVPHSYRSRTVGVAAMSPGVLSIDARTEIAVTIIESIAALEGAKPYYELVQAWAKQDPAKEPEIPKDAETHIRLLARALRVNPARLLLPDADIHAVGKLLASYFRKLLRLARPPGEAEFLGVGPNVVPTEVCVGVDEED